MYAVQPICIGLSACCQKLWCQTSEWSSEYYSCCNRQQRVNWEWQIVRCSTPLWVHDACSVCGYIHLTPFLQAAAWTVHTATYTNIAHHLPQPPQTAVQIDHPLVISYKETMTDYGTKTILTTLNIWCSFSSLKVWKIPHKTEG